MAKCRSYLCRKSSVAHGTFERPLFSMTPVMDLESRVARERFETDVARGVSSSN